MGAPINRWGSRVRRFWFLTVLSLLLIVGIALLLLAIEEVVQ